MVCLYQLFMLKTVPVDIWVWTAMDYNYYNNPNYTIEIAIYWLMEEYHVEWDLIQIKGVESVKSSNIRFSHCWSELCSSALNVFSLISKWFYLVFSLSLFYKLIQCDFMSKWRWISSIHFIIINLWN